MASSEENVTTAPEPETIEVQAVQSSPDGFHPHRGAKRQTAILVAAAALAALALMIYSGIHSRAAAESRLTKRTEEAAIPTVAVVFPREGAPTQEIVLPGNTQAFPCSSKTMSVFFERAVFKPMCMSSRRKAFQPSAKCTALRRRILALRDAC